MAFLEGQVQGGFSMKNVLRIRNWLLSENFQPFPGVMNTGWAGRLELHWVSELAENPYAHGSVCLCLNPYSVSGLCMNGDMRVTFKEMSL